MPAMPKVTFLYDKLTVEVPSGAALPDVVDQCGATLPFSCRSGTCGTCRCLIVAGKDNINPMTETEAELFECFTSVGRNERLGCQIIINGDVTIAI